MALAFNLAAVPVKFVAIPVLAGLAAGTGALGAYVVSPSAATSAPAMMVAALPSAPAAPPAPVAAEQAAPAKPTAKPPCEQQTWPYLDGRCIGRSNGTRNVRVVMAPRAGEAATTAAAAADLVTSDTVLRGPSVAPEVKEVVKKPAQRSEQRRHRSRDVTVREVGSRDGFKRVYSVHSVSGESVKPVIVVRPLPLNAYSSRF